MEYQHRDRYGENRWTLVHGSYDGIERIAVDSLQRSVQRHLPYVLTVRPAGDDVSRDDNLAMVGTCDGNPLLREIAEGVSILSPPGPQGYAVAAMPSPWAEGKKVVAVAGFDPAGVLHGVHDFNARIMAAQVMPEDPREMQKAFDEIEAFTIVERPAIERRGIWSWGYTIYDYRRFLDNMARLKMNELTIWNDVVPANARQVIDYAHERGIRIVWGYHWGWGLEGLDLASRDDCRRVKKQVVDTYVQQYQDLAVDGIYFQTLTEHNDLERSGRSTASLACDWVNEISAALYEVDPDLYIQFGLHATSIRENYKDLASLDERVTIVWEDAGVLPFAYSPERDIKAGRPDSLESTIEYCRQLATFRPNSEFAMVPKGWINIRWRTDFEHHGPFILGERAPSFIRQRLRERQPLWNKRNASWLKDYALAARFYRKMLDCGPPRMTVTALVEDGMIEEVIQPSVALFAETIWDPRRDDDEILELAMSPYYREGAG